MTDQTYGQRLAQWLRAWAGYAETTGWERTASDLLRKADLAEREWPLPRQDSYKRLRWDHWDARVVLWLPTAHSPPILVAWGKGDTWAVLNKQNPTPDDLRDAILWLVGMRETHD